jgi:16S rRNA (uracil1498-N3)-methyltransferase
MDYVVQKATELGVTEIQPVIVERSVVRLDAERADRKVKHWQSIAISAAEQSGRSVVPVIAAPATLDICLSGRTPDSTGIVLQPGEHPGIAAQVRDAQDLILLTGPEGGFTDDEVAAATAGGFLPASIGPRILRSETAPVAALAILQSVGGDLI